MVVAGALEKPKLSRLTRLDLDLTFRSRGEAALMRVAYYGRAAARFVFRTGGTCLGVAFIAAMVVPRLAWVEGLVALVGIGAVLLGGLIRVVAFLAAGPVHTTRAVRLQLWSRTDDTDGGRTSLRGRVVPLRTVKTVDGKPAVFVRTRATRGGRGAEKIQAEDFLLDDGSGSPARVAVEHALFLDRPTPVFGSWMGIPLEFFPLLPRRRKTTQLEEAVLFPGEQVEVIGRVETVVDPSVSDRYGRETPLLRIIGGTPEEPLLLRSVASSED